jgi:hypothetical protein
MINWKGFERKRSWPNYKVLSLHLVLLLFLFVSFIGMEEASL